MSGMTILGLCFKFSYQTVINVFRDEISFER